MNCANAATTCCPDCSDSPPASVRPIVGTSSISEQPRYRRFQIVETERQCCPFFRFEIAIEPSSGPVVLTLTGPAGTREFIESFIGG